MTVTTYTPGTELYSAVLNADFAKCLDMTTASPQTIAGPLTVGSLNVTTLNAAQILGGSANGALNLSWAGGSTVQNGVYYFSLYAPYSGSIVALDYLTASGSFTADVQIAGQDVTGLSAVAVSSPTRATATATANNTFTVGQAITGIVSGMVGNPTGAVLNLRIMQT